MAFISTLSTALYPVLPFLLYAFWSPQRENRKNALFSALLFLILFVIFTTALLTLGGLPLLNFFSLPYVTLLAAFILLILALFYAKLLSIPFVHENYFAEKNTSAWMLVLLVFIAIYLSLNLTKTALANFFTSLYNTNGSILKETFIFSLGLGLPLFIIATLFVFMPKIQRFQNYLPYASGIILIATAFHIAEDLVADFPAKGQLIPFALLGLGMCVTFFLLAEPNKSEGAISMRYKINTSGMLLLSGLGLFLFTSFFVKYGSADAKPMTETFTLKEAKDRAPMALPQGRLKWYGNLDEAKKIAAKENKILFIDFWADWCAACEEMEKKLFTQDEFIDFALEKNILPVRVDYSTPTEELDKLAHKYNIRGLPTVVLAKSNGELIHTLLGFYNKLATMRELRLALKD